jgi:hypothetical protein
MITGLYKRTKFISIEVIGSDELSISDNFKNTVHKSIGDKNYYEYIGKGDQELNLKLYVKDKSGYNDLVSFFEDGEPFWLSLGEVEDIYNLSGGIKATKSYADNSYLVDLSFTSAQDPNFDEVGFNITGLGGISETTYSKTTVLDRLREWGNKTIDFVGNTNASVAAYTGKFQEYSVAITQLTGGIASSSSIITSPISSVRNSISGVIGGVSAIVSSIGTAINAIRQLPSDVSNMIDSILDIGDLFSALFNFDDKEAQVKTTTNFLIDVGNALIIVDQTPSDGKTVTEDPYSVEFDAEVAIAAFDNKNNDVLSVLILSSILLSIYEQSTQINVWNKRDLDNLLKQTETLFDYIMNKEISSDIRTNLILARNNFFESFNALYKNASNIVQIKLDSPRFLSDVVYSVNGNFDYYLDTKKLNNIIGAVVEGNIEVISND